MHQDPLRLLDAEPQERVTPSSVLDSFRIMHVCAPHRSLFFMRLNALTKKGRVL
jgi:hypothetical protein